MSTTKLLIGLIVVAAVGFGAHWFIKNQISNTDTEITSGPDNSQASLERDSEESNGDSNSVPYMEADVESSQSSNINSDLTALDSLYEEEYDDSDLDGTFSEEGANSLTTTYEY